MGSDGEKPETACPFPVPKSFPLVPRNAQIRVVPRSLSLKGERRLGTTTEQASENAVGEDSPPGAPPTLTRRRLSVRPFPAAKDTHRGEIMTWPTAMALFLMAFAVPMAVHHAKLHVHQLTEEGG